MLSAIQRGWQHPRPLNRLLYPLSLLYASAMQARRQAYRLGVLKSHKLPLPFIVVGNLTVGGVGKTPLLIALVQHLKTRGLAPGVISRGYRGRSAAWPREVTEHVTAAEVGDEPVLIFQRCQVPVVVGPNRMRSARRLLAKHHCDILLSDDGFQHLALQRDMDIVVVDGERRFGNGWCLPAGPLREPRRALQRATLIVVNQQRAQPTRSGEFAMHTSIEWAVRLGDRGDGGGGGRQTPPQVCKLSDFGGQTVHAVAGLGNPERFFNQLRAHRIQIIAHPYPDHHMFTPADFDFAAAQPNLPVLMTEKDAVKCSPLLASGALTAGAAQRYWKVPLQVRLAPELLSAVRARL